MRGSITLIARGMFSHRDANTVENTADWDVGAGSPSLVDYLPSDLSLLAPAVATESGHDKLLEECVLNACYPDLDTEGFALAALSYQADAGVELTEPDVHRILRCDPVYLKPGGRGLSFDLPTVSDLSLADAQSITQTINETLADFAVQLEPVTPTRWYLRLSSEADARFAAPWLVRREGLAQSMPAGADASLWVEIMTACQIALHTAPANLQRETRGEPPVTGVWPWGAGRLDRATQPAFDRIVAREGLARGLARHFDRALDSMPVQPVADALLLVCDDGWSERDAGLIEFLVDRWRGDELTSLTIVDPETGAITFNADLRPSTGILGRWRERRRRRRTR